MKTKKLDSYDGQQSVLLRAQIPVEQKMTPKLESKLQIQSVVKAPHIRRFLSSYGHVICIVGDC